MVNATINPFLNVPAQVVRLRLLNGSSQRVFNFGFKGDHPFYQIASDGGLLGKPVFLTRLQLAPGERAEIIVDFSGKTGQSVHLMSYASELPNGIYGAASPGMMQMTSLTGYNPNPLNGTNFNVIEFKITAQTSNPVLTIPSSLVSVSRLKESNANLTRNLTISPAVMGPNQLNGKFLINGLYFNMNVINFFIPLNNTEIWSISNQSVIAHPFHIHDVQFYILDRNGIPPSANEQGRKDVVLVRPMETVRFITQFTDFANDSVPYMLHCHMLAHEDDGMMLQFEVIDKTTAISNNIFEPESLKIYPNPVSGENQVLTVSGFKRGINFVELFSLNGMKLFERYIPKNTDKININMNDFRKGGYLLRIKGENREETQKIIKE
jgi:bilirubin oxidase